MKLNLYNSRITIRLDKKEKDFIKSNAYSKKITLSEYIRQLILIDNRKTNIDKQISKLEKNLKDIYKAEVRIGRDEK
ncbi:MAG: DUF6290 family protein [Candidatus Aphodocola sp.]